MAWRFIVILLPFAIAVSAADNGAALYKAKCSQCHGANGEGKAAMKAPALKGDSAPTEQIQQILMQGDPAKKAPHSKAISGLTPEQAKAVVEYVKTLQ